MGRRRGQRNHNNGQANASNALAVIGTLAASGRQRAEYSGKDFHLVAQDVRVEKSGAIHVGTLTMTSGQYRQTYTSQGQMVTYPG